MDSDMIKLCKERLEKKIKKQKADLIRKEVEHHRSIMTPLYEKRNEVIKTIPNFWLTVFLNNKTLSKQLNNTDKKIFEFLSSIEVDKFEAGHSIDFVFQTNDYFSNTNLKKTFTYNEDGELVSINSTKIDWKPNKGIPDKIDHNNEGLSTSNLSFFHWFYSTMEKDELIFEDKIAGIIKDEVFPDALKFLDDDHNNLEGEGPSEERNY
ncbi:NAP1-related protein 2-like isoform X1 [Trifolium pratense]|uniref:NAP1-related protein 2-like isoform X1 n=1 Tax=Trifolium pratense TaxID=57577 RepID=UPI001E691D8E|nr:NAP1-related protein 2-like isoform X1 [Trifolium pratense]XP_045789623.1 NAP1-related protein 2-like isoform X1 [Trifolium pratense]XP_045789624.1 NAP1-related protein 2-like isoform X1 [Trifolium pratense]